MNIIDEIVDFFVRLIRGRIDAVQIRARSKLMGVQARAKSAAAKQFNDAVDGAVGKARGKVLPDARPQPSSVKPPIGKQPPR